MYLKWNAPLTQHLSTLYCFTFLFLPPVVNYWCQILEIFIIIIIDNQKMVGDEHLMVWCAFSHHYHGYFVSKNDANGVCQHPHVEPELRRTRGCWHGCKKLFISHKKKNCNAQYKFMLRCCLAISVMMIFSFSMMWLILVQQCSSASQTKDPQNQITFVFVVPFFEGLSHGPRDGRTSCGLCGLMNFHTVH